MGIARSSAVCRAVVVAAIVGLTCPLSVSPSTAQPPGGGTPGIGSIVIAPAATPVPSQRAVDWRDQLPSLVWALVLLIIVMSFHRRIAVLIGVLPRFVSRIKGPGGVEIEFTPEAAKEVSSVFQDSFKDLMDQAKTAYDHAVEVNRVYERLGEVLTEALPEILMAENIVQNEAPGYRGTIHVPDVVFRDYLYQLTDYFPSGNGGSGRRFSVRYGIIGRAWRLKRSLGQGDAIPQGQPDQATRDQLIGNWGMLPSEAVPGSHGKPAYLCVMLRDAEQYQGLIFVDSGTINAFGADDIAERVAARLAVAPQTILLAGAILETMKPLRQSGTFLAISR